MKYRIKIIIENLGTKHSEVINVTDEYASANEAILSASMEALDKMKMCQQYEPSTFADDEEEIPLEDLTPKYYGLADGLDVLAVIPPAERFIFAKWNAVKYIVRNGKKSALTACEDLKKAIRYIEVMMDVLRGDNDDEAGKPH